MIVHNSEITFEQIASWNYHYSLPKGKLPQILSLEIDFSNICLESFQMAISYVCFYNENLRVIISLSNEHITQEIQPYEETNKYYEFFDFRSKNKSSDVLRNFISKKTREMDVRKRCKLCHTFLFRTSDDSYKCVFLLHHIISDRWSLGLIKNQVSTVYNKALNKESVPFDSSKVISIVEYQKSQYDNFLKYGNKITDYWLHLLKDILAPNSISNEITNQAYDVFKPLGFLQNSSNVLNTSPCSETLFKIDGDSWKKAKFIMQDSSVSILVLFNVAFSLMPYYFNKSKKTLIASTVRNNFSPTTKRLVGFLNGGIYSYMNMDSNSTVKDVLRKEYAVLLNSMKHIITSHEIYKIDGSRLREFSDLYINLIPKSFNMEINESLYDFTLIKSCEQSFYGLEFYIIETYNGFYIKCIFSNSSYDFKSIKKIVESLKQTIEIMSKNMHETLSKSKALYQKRNVL